MGLDKNGSCVNVFLISPRKIRCGYSVDLPGLATYFIKIDREIFSMVTLSLMQIKEGQLSVSGKRLCASTGNLIIED